MNRSSFWGKLGNHRLLTISGVVVATAVASVIAVKARAAGIPAANAILYTGYLETPKGEPMTTEVTVAINLWDGADEGDKVCEVEGQAVTPLAGRFQVQLVDVCAQAIAANPNLWLEPLVDGVSLGRSRLGAVPYAVEANHAVEADVASADGELAKELAAVKADLATLKGRLDTTATSTLTASKNRVDLTAIAFTWVSGTAPTKLAAGRYWVTNTMRTYKGASAASASGAYLSVCSRVGDKLTVLPSTVVSESDGGVSLPTSVIDYVDLAAETDAVELGVCAKQISAQVAPTVIAEIHTAVLQLPK